MRELMSYALAGNIVRPIKVGATATFFRIDIDPQFVSNIKESS